jgi:hypothetical protein
MSTIHFYVSGWVCWFEVSAVECVAWSQAIDRSNSTEFPDVAQMCKRAHNLGLFDIDPTFMSAWAPLRWWRAKQRISLVFYQFHV